LGEWTNLVTARHRGTPEREDKQSERRFVTKRIAIETLLQAKAGPTFVRCFMAKDISEPVNCKKQMNVNHTCALQHNIEDWDTIKWSQIIYRVNRLQFRIAKAIREGKWGKAKSLMFLIKYRIAGFPFAGKALKVLEPYAGKLAQPVPHSGIRFLGGVSYPVVPK